VAFVGPLRSNGALVVECRDRTHVTETLMPSPYTDDPHTAVGWTSDDRRVVHDLGRSWFGEGPAPLHIPLPDVDATCWCSRHGRIAVAYSRLRQVVAGRRRTAPLDLVVTP